MKGNDLFNETDPRGLFGENNENVDGVNQTATLKTKSQSVVTKGIEKGIKVK